MVHKPLRPEQTCQEGRGSGEEQRRPQYAPRSRRRRAEHSTRRPRNRAQSDQSGTRNTGEGGSSNSTPAGSLIDQPTHRKGVLLQVQDQVRGRGHRASCRLLVVVQARKWRMRGLSWGRRIASAMFILPRRTSVQRTQTQPTPQRLSVQRSAFSAQRTDPLDVVWSRRLREVTSKGAHVQWLVVIHSRQ